MIKKNNWSANGFGKYVSPDLISDEFLDTVIVILLQGNNLFGDAVYSYLEITGANLKKVFSCMQQGENFKPADYGTILSAGRGEPSEEVRAEMKKEYNMMDIPKPKSNVKIPTFQPKYFAEE